MTSFVHVDQPATHPGVARAEAVIDRIRAARRSFDGARGLAALLLAAIVASAARGGRPADVDLERRRPARRLDRALGRGLRRHRVLRRHGAPPGGQRRRPRARGSSPPRSGPRRRAVPGLRQARSAHPARLQAIRLARKRRKSAPQRPTSARSRQAFRERSHADRTSRAAYRGRTAAASHLAPAT